MMHQGHPAEQPAAAPAAGIPGAPPPKPAPVQIAETHGGVGVVYSKALFALLAFAVVASATHESFGGPASASFKSYSALSFLVAVGVLDFIWAIGMLVFGIMLIRRMVILGDNTSSSLPTTVFALDSLLAFLTFGAACAAAGLMSGLSSVHDASQEGVPFCDSAAGSGGDFCAKAKASTVFLFITWLLLIPSVWINARNVAGPW